MSPDDGAAIWSWAREMQRWAELATVCNDAKAEAAGKTPPKAPVTLLPKDIEELVPALSDPRVTFTVGVEDCGDINSYYFPETHRIVVCSETIAVSHALARAFLAHEIGHAYIVQLDLPFTGSHEAAADEFAALALIATGHVEDLPAVADYYYKLSKDPDNEPAGWDDHPTNGQRYHTVRCLYADAVHSGAILCRHDLPRIIRTWNRMLNS